MMYTVKHDVEGCLSEKNLKQKALMPMNYYSFELEDLGKNETKKQQSSEQNKDILLRKDQVCI